MLNWFRIKVLKSMYLLSLGCEYRNGFPEGGGYDYKSKKIVIKVLNGMGGTFLRYRTKHL